MTPHIAVVGDTLLDRDVDGDVSRLVPGAAAAVLDERSTRSRPGGAGLAAVLAARDGCDVTLVTALSSDPAGDELRRLLQAAGVRVADLGLIGPTAEKIRFRAGGTCLLRLDRGQAPGRRDVGELTRAAVAAIADADVVLASDYGRGVCDHDSVRAAVAAAAERGPVVWDPHPRGQGPVTGAAVVTPNQDEAAAWVPAASGGAGDARPVAASVLAAATWRARQLCQRWHADAVSVTLGARGAVLVTAASDPCHPGAADVPVVVPAPVVAGGDSCGAGDRFAAAVAAGLARRSTPADAVERAVLLASRFVADGGAAGLDDHPGATGHGASHEGEAALALAARVRAAGGTVVATGGCFDLLHAGHVQSLEAARSLGDCLVVCLNSDRSVAALKGGDRPLVHEAERARLLLALSSVDAVAVFDDPTPAPLLARLRPDIFAKGGDYTAGSLPEAAVVEGYGGQVVTLPYREGKSTTRLIEMVTRRHGGEVTA